MRRKRAPGAHAPGASFLVLMVRRQRLTPCGIPAYLPSMKTTRASIACRITATVLVAGGLIAAPFARAFVPGGGKDAAKGNDCLIGYNGVDPDQVTVEGKKNVFTCQDCDPS